MFDAGKGAADASAWKFVGLSVKDGKAIAAIENTDGVYTKVKLGGVEYANTAAEGANPKFEIPVDLNGVTSFAAFYQTKDSKDNAYETSTAFQLAVELDESASAPNVAIDVPAAVAGLKYTGKELTGVPAGEGYEVAGGSAVAIGSYTATVTLKTGFVWADGTYEAKQVDWSIGKGVSTIKLAAPKAAKYTGKAIAFSGKVTKTGSAGKVTYDYYSDKACKKAVKAANVKNAGTYYVKATVAADANYDGATSSAVAMVINKADNTLKAKAVKAKQTIKAGKSLAANKAFKVTKNVSKGAVTYKKASGNAKITVASNGKITVKKALKAGTYPVKVKLTSKATANYNAASATVTLKIVVVK